MFSRKNPQSDLFGYLNRLTDWVGKDSFYAFMGREGPTLFSDDFFKDWYCKDNGRPCVPPSILAIATVLQMYTNCSDEEAVERTKFDERWKVALDLQEREKPFAKSTFQEFRTNIVLNEVGEKLFLRRSLELAKKYGLLQASGEKSGLRIALDTSPITGRGAVKDTFNLIGDGVRLLVRALAEATKNPILGIAEQLELGRYFANKSLKGGAEIDWSNDTERRNFLNTLAADALRLLKFSGEKRAALGEEKLEEREAALWAEVEKKQALLRRLVTQDTELDPTDPEGKRLRIKQGTAKDRVPSAHDPESRHGRKSKSKTFVGHKVSVSTDVVSGLVMAVDVIPGNAPDNHEAVEMVQATEENSGIPVDKSIGDCAYGDGATRNKFLDAGREHVAKVPSPPAGQPFHKAHFDIDIENSCVTCPAGHVTREFETVKDPNGEPVKRFYFPVAVCQPCPHRAECIKSKSENCGRSVTLHAQESLLQEARTYQETDQFRQDITERQEVEHSLARMMQFGARQARYRGRAKVKVQQILIATVVNLVLLFPYVSGQNSTSPQPGGGSGQADKSTVARTELEANIESSKKIPASRVRGAPPGQSNTNAARAA